MPRDLPIGNGSFLANFDSTYTLRDLYFPRVGRDNNTIGHPNRMGLWVAGRFAWLHEDGWTRRLAYEPDTIVTDVELQQPALGIIVHIHDAVGVRVAVPVRQAGVPDLSRRSREVRRLATHG